ncbi:hypothetical protein BLOT_009968 [Blomia tropicalis]|nr:hypothetical protein BLOT_009968 [Blomia tropicalis]
MKKKKNKKDKAKIQRVNRVNKCGGQIEKKRRSFKIKERIELAPKEVTTPSSRLQVVVVVVVVHDKAVVSGCGR